MTLTEELGVKPGDIFYCSWGYDQTNVNFYEVVRVTATKAELRPIGARRIDGEMTYDMIVPDRRIEREFDVLLDIERDDEKRTKLRKVIDSRGDPTIVLEAGRYWASRWSGRPQYQTAYGFGH